MLKSEHYCISRENIAAHELIGLEVRVAQSTDAARKGISGKIVDETKNVFVVEKMDGVEIKLPKAECGFEFSLGNEKVLVDGKKILYRPEQRLKALSRNLHG